MIPVGGERAWDAFKNPFAMMDDAADFAVHGLWRADHLSAKDLSNALGAKTDAKHGNPTGRTPNECKANSGAIRIAGTRRDYDAHGIERQSVSNRQRVV